MHVSHLARPRRLVVAGVAALSVLGLAGLSASASTPGTDRRLTHDNPGSTGYVSNYNVNHPTTPVTKDPTLVECSRSRGRENEPSVAIDPRNTNVIVGSSNDYCGVYNDSVDADGAPIPSGPIWLGYYRSQNGGTSFQSSLVPGYPGDSTPYASRAHIRTASSGDAVLAWDKQGRLFAGSESSGDAEGSPKGFGDVYVATYVNHGGTSGATINDGKEFARSEIVAKGSSAPAEGVFNDKTAIEVDRTSSACTGDVYIAYSRFTGNGGVAIYLSRSTDHGATFSAPTKVSAGVHDVQFPDISVTRNGHVYITYRQFESHGQQTDAVDLVKSVNCGQSFSAPRELTTFSAMGVTDLTTAGGRARDCGDSPPCQSGYTFFRADSGPRSTADQAARSEVVHVAYEAIVPGTKVDTGTTFGWADEPGVGGQSAIYYLSFNGATGALATRPARVARATASQQLFPDLSVDRGVIHALWWDSRNDTKNDATSFTTRPVGNDAHGNVGRALDDYASTRLVSGGSWATATRLTSVTSNPNYEQFGGRTVPFAGDYLWIDSKAGVTYGVWTDWRNTVAGIDQRETTVDETGADVKQCRTEVDGVFTGDTCPRAGGLDQDIYGDFAP